MAANSATNSGSLYRAAVTTNNDNFSLSFWIYLNSTGADNYTIFQNGVTGGFGQGWGLYWSASDGKLHIDVNYVADIAFGSTLSANTWYHVILTRSSGTWTLYINNVSDGTDTDTPFGLDGSSRTVLFGYWTDGTTINNDGTNMRLAELGFWDRVINSTERAALASCSSTPDDYPTNLLVHLPLTVLANFAVNGGSAGNFTLNGSLALADHPAQCSAPPATVLKDIIGVGVVPFPR